MNNNDIAKYVLSSSKNTSILIILTIAIANDAGIQCLTKSSK